MFVFFGWIPNGVVDFCDWVDKCQLLVIEYIVIGCLVSVELPLE